MIKPILFIITLFISAVFAQNHAQTSEHISAKNELINYELTFSPSDFEKIESMEMYITSISKAILITFDEINHSIIIRTDRQLDFNIIYGKFIKKDIELLTFVKL